nr:PAS domain S-box protein [uncultured Desulfobacter sp.]
MPQGNQKEKDIQVELQAQKKLITDLKQKAYNLVQENKYLRELYDRSPLGYQSLDENGCIVETNKAWLDLLGYSREEVIGQNFGNFLGEKWRAHYKEKFPKLKAVGEILGFEFEMIKKDGSILMVNLDGRIGKKASGEFQQTYCIIKDITRQKKDEVTRQKLQKELQQAQKMESFGRIAAGMAHEINNPLAGMIQNASVMRSRLENMDMPANFRVAKELGISLEGIRAFMEKRKIFRMLDMIHESGLRVAEIVSSMLGFARKSEPCFSSHYPNELIDKIIQLCATDYDLKKQYDFKSVEIIKLDVRVF